MGVLYGYYLSEFYGSSTYKMAINAGSIYNKKGSSPIAFAQLTLKVKTETLYVQLHGMVWVHATSSNRIIKISVIKM